jgi:hypothetical protein
MPPRHGDSPLCHGTRWILFGNAGENPARLFIEERVQQGDAANEFRLRGRCARYGEIHFAGRAQIARFRGYGGFGAEGCETGDQKGEKRRDAKECSNTHVKATTRLTQPPLSCKFENDFAAQFSTSELDVGRSALNVGRFHPK